MKITGEDFGTPPNHPEKIGEDNNHAGNNKAARYYYKHRAAEIDVQRQVIIKAIHLSLLQNVIRSVANLQTQCMIMLRLSLRFHASTHHTHL